jgi:hypothetical protein
MAGKNYEEHARVTSICVNLALDGVEADLREALDQANDEAAAVLRAVLEKLRQRRIQQNELEPTGTC